MIQKIKRVPLGKASLKDIIEEDAVLDLESASESGNAKSENENHISEIGNQKTDIVIPKKEIENTKSDIAERITDIGKDISDIGNQVSKTVEEQQPTTIPPATAEIINPISEIETPKDKSDYLKVTATLEPKLFWMLEEERRRRRVAKLEYTFSEIIREALTDYFIKHGKEI